MADPRQFQRNLRDLVNTNPSVMATPGANLGDVTAAHFGEQAMQDARARGEETQSELKGLALARTKERVETGMESRERLHEAGLEAKEESHLADIAFAKEKGEREKGLYNEELATAKRQSERALLFTGFGTAIKLGSVMMKEKETTKLMDRFLGQEGAYADLLDFVRKNNGVLLSGIGDRIKIQHGAFRNETERKFGGSLVGEHVLQE